MPHNLYHLVVTADIRGAMQELSKNMDVTPLGFNRGFDPTGKQYLIVSEGSLPKAAQGLELSSFEYLLSNNPGAHDAALNARLTGSL